MPTIADLKAKWFIPIDGSAPDDVPCRRHTDLVGADAVNVSTDGNTVTFLIDGEEYMRRWHQEVLAVQGLAGAEIYHAGWRFEAVHTLGITANGTDALEDLDEADEAATKVYPLVCRNVGTMRFNLPTVDWLRLHGIWTACMDNRFPAAGSNHQKFAVMKSDSGSVALLGSIDVSKSRWDTSDHLSSNPDRDPSQGKQTHDTGVLIRGPAVADIERTYRERWNDGSGTFGLEPVAPPQPQITSTIRSHATAGTHSIQVLRTYGITSRIFGYSWAQRGEFTVWASYLNAIKKASTYIYIEDQYFLPFDWQPCHTRSGLAQSTDIIYQLGEAIKRGVRVAILTPSNAEDKAHVFQKYQRDIGVNYLISLIMDPAVPGELVVASLENVTDVYVHSKLMIVDDELVLIGSANVCQRSMTHDGELQVAIVDGNNTFAKEFRKALWAEHTGESPSSLENPIQAYSLFSNAATNGDGHLKPYPHDIDNVFPERSGSKPPPLTHRKTIRYGIDPYAGPSGLR
jgi:phosphatidylserine/phosphatidylglycerophosphate/cardiolipin synthase-like enzyme